MSLAPARPPATRAELRVFAAGLALFALVLAALVAYRPRGLFVAASLLGVGWATSLLARPEHRSRASVGTGLPFCLAALAGSATWLVSPRIVAVIAASALVAVAAGVLASLSFGRAVHDGWMEAVAPMGWTVSHLVLALVFFLVLTPIGLLLRATGRDSLRLRRGAAGSTGWLEHSTPSDARRYFRQF